MSVDLNKAGQTLTETGYDGKFKVHINCPINGMFQTIDVSDGTEKVIIKNTIINLENIKLGTNQGAFMAKKRLDDMTFNLVFENCAVINANLGNNGSGFIGAFNTTNSTKNDEFNITFKNCYAHIIKLQNITYSNTGFIGRKCPYNIYIYTIVMYIMKIQKKSRDLQQTH